MEMCWYGRLTSGDSRGFSVVETFCSSVPLPISFSGVTLPEDQPSGEAPTMGEVLICLVTSQ
jgi:hypothetical protein